MSYANIVSICLVLLLFASCNLERDNPLDGHPIPQLPLLNFSGFTVASDNNNDKQINKGESIKLNVSLKNNGKSKAKKVRGTISCTSSYISALSPISAIAFYENGSSSFDYIDVGKVGTVESSTSYISFNVSNTTPLGTLITFNVSITDELSNTWSDTFTITVVATGATIRFSSFTVYSDNNNDKQINKGESIKLNISLKNSGSSRANKVRGTITCTSSYISTLSPTTSIAYYAFGSGSYDYIDVGGFGSVESSTSYLSFNVSNITPAGTVITFNIAISDESTNTWSDSFTITVVATGASIGFNNFIVTADNNNDKQINKGESIKLNVSLKNSGSSRANKVRGTITCTSSYISTLSPTTSIAYYAFGSGSYDYIDVGGFGSVESSTSYLSFNVSNITPAGTVITFNIAISDESTNTWSDSFTITVVATGASIGFNNFIVTADNNNDKQINKGESIKLNVSLKNSGSSRANKVRGTITCTSSYISTLSPTTSIAYYAFGSGSYDYIDVGGFGSVESSTSYLSFNVSNITPAGTVITFNIAISDESTNTWSDSFTITVL